MCCSKIFSSNLFKNIKLVLHQYQIVKLDLILLKDLLWLAIPSRCCQSLWLLSDSEWNAQTLSLSPQTLIKQWHHGRFDVHLEVCSATCLFLILSVCAEELFVCLTDWVLCRSCHGTVLPVTQPSREPHGWRRGEEGEGQVCIRVHQPWRKDLRVWFRWPEESKDFLLCLFFF